MSDLIDRQAALKKLAVYIHLIDKTMGKGLLTDDDCMEAAKSVLGEDELPAVQPATNCSEIPNGSDDTISRRAAIDALDKRFDNVPMGQTAEILKLRKDLRELPSVQPEKRTEERAETHACDLIDRQAAINTAIEAADEWDGGTSFSRDEIIERRLKMIPAVHTADIGKKAEGDCISRKEALDAFGLSEKTRKYGGDHSGYDTRMLYEIQDTLENLPAVKPEIIRCKDCKYWRDDHTCHEHSLVSPMCANEYCSRAERRTDETD